MRLRFLLLCVLSASVVRAEIVDRIVATVARQAITLSDLRLQYRLECFVSGKELGAMTEAKSNELLGRLVDQALIRREMGENTFPPATPEEVEAILKQNRARYPDDAAWRAALERYDLTPTDLHRLAQFQADVESFINLRVRPGLQAPASEVEKYYQQEFVQEMQRRNLPVPPLDEVRGQITDLVLERAKDQRLASLLEEMRARTEVHKR